VLGVVPFTAPFAAFDLFEITSERVLHSGASQLKVGQDTTDLASIMINGISVTPDVALDFGVLSNRTDVRPIRFLVLRI
jgi:hypothetical protein